MMNSIAEISKIYGITAPTLYILARKQNLPYTTICRTRYYSIEDSLKMVLSLTGNPEAIINAVKHVLKKELKKSSPELFNTYESKINF